MAVSSRCRLDVLTPGHQDKPSPAERGMLVVVEVVEVAEVMRRGRGRVLWLVG
jgi:hypothetical protein